MYSLNIPWRYVWTTSLILFPAPGKRYIELFLESVEDPVYAAATDGYGYPVQCTSGWPHFDPYKLDLGSF